MKNGRNRMVSGEDVPKKTNPKVWWLLFDHLGNGPNSWWVCLGTSIFSLFSLCAYVAYYDWRPHATWFDTISSIFCMRNKSHYMYQEIDTWTRTFHDPFTDQKLVDQPLPGPRSQTLPRPSWWWKASPRACRTAVAACCAERPWTSCAIMTLGHGDTRISLAPLVISWL